MNLKWNQILAIFVFIVVLLNTLTHIFFEGFDWAELIWFCDLMSYILAYALWTKNRFVISTVFLASVPAQFMWIVDFFMQLSGSGMGRTAWMFEDSYVWWTPFISTVMHAILIPVSAYAIYKLGFVKKAILGVYFIIFTLLPISYFFTDPTINRNCVFYPCDLNFIDDKAVIEANPIYMSKAYLLQTITDWLIYGTAFWILSLLVLFVYRRYIKRLNFS